MNSEEIREKLINSPHKLWADEQVLPIRITTFGINQQVKGLVAINEFARQQLKGWDTFTQPLRPELQKSKLKSEKIIDAVNEVVTSLTAQNIEKLKARFSTSIADLYHPNDRQILIYGMPETDFLFELDQKYPVSFRGAFEYLTDTIVNELIYQKNYFLGMQIAADYSVKLKGLKQLGLDTNSLDLAGKNTTTYLSNAEKQLSDLLQKIKIEEGNLIAEISLAKEAKETEFSRWFVESRTTFEGFHAESNSKIKELETTFQEHLRLKEPAEYWSKRAEKLNNEARNYLKILVALLAFGGFCLYFLLWKTPDGMLRSFFNDDKSIALRWSIVFITFISLIFIGLRVVSKVMFSSYHLARDAEERQQLTYVYLALRKDASVDEKDRQLIIQSLFSRADTGLLKEDSSPTMPGALDKIINK